MQQMASIKKHRLWLIVNLLALIPLAQLGWQLATSPLGMQKGTLLLTGRTALILLVISLACTPIASIIGFRVVLSVRKSLGLWGFLYAMVHLLVFLARDTNWQLEMAYLLIRYKAAYAQAGLAALILLLPLALTSNKWAMRRLGKNWKRIHRLVYLAVPLVVVHFWWRRIWVSADGFEDLLEPVLYAIVVGLLLLMRLSPVRQYLRTLGQRSVSNRASN